MDGQVKEIQASTEQRIKEAAKREFIRKGFAATRTRDIAEASGINLALLNYYFRSKQNLFNIIMMEELQLFLHSIIFLLNDRNTTLFEKIDLVVDHYIDMLKANPDLPMFVLHEVRSDPTKLMTRVGGPDLPMDLYFISQWHDIIATGKVPEINPLHFLLNIVSLSIFPFIGSPVFKNRFKLSAEEFNQLMDERKKLIPIWVKGMLQVG